MFHVKHSSFLDERPQTPEFVPTNSFFIDGKNYPAKSLQRIDGEFARSRISAPIKLKRCLGRNCR
jgi:hypothetical protein